MRVVADFAEQPHDGAAGTGLAEADAAAAARVRLRAARLYDGEATPSLYVNVTVPGGAYAVTLLLFKPMRDLASGGTGLGRVLVSTASAGNARRRTRAHILSSGRGKHGPFHRRVSAGERGRVPGPS